MALQAIGPKRPPRFTASFGKDVSVEIIELGGKYYWVFRKALDKYECFKTASAAPETNYILSSPDVASPDSFEACIAQHNVFDEQVIPASLAVGKVFGMELELGKISLALGQNENDYVSVDEGDLAKMHVKTTIRGVQEYMQKHQNDIFGFSARQYDAAFGNLVFIHASIAKPTKNIASVDYDLIASLPQHAYSMSGGSGLALQEYVTTQASTLEDSDVLALFKELGVDWEKIFLYRQSGIEAWLDIECTRDTSNLMSYLRTIYTELEYNEVQEVVNVVKGNDLNSLTASRIAELLNNYKAKTKQPIEKAAVVAAAIVITEYQGNELDLARVDVSKQDISRFKKELEGEMNENPLVPALEFE